MIVAQELPQFRIEAEDVLHGGDRLVLRWLLYVNCPTPQRYLSGPVFDPDTLRGVDSRKGLVNKRRLLLTRHAAVEVVGVNGERKEGRRR